MNDKDKLMPDKLSTLHHQIEKLIHLHQQSLIENKKLVELNQRLTEKIEDQKNAIQQLDEKLKAAKTAQVISGGSERENKEVREKITQYITEIDRCLALMNR